MNDDFGTFVSTSGPRLLRFAVLITGQRADAEDLLQEVLVQVYPRWLGCTEAETAAELGCSAGSVKSQASRGLHRLRAGLEGAAATPIDVAKENHA